MSTASDALRPRASRTAPADSARRERLFFGAMALALAVTVFVGFAPTYYLNGAFGAPKAFNVALYLHGAAFSAWMVLLVVQTSLVAAGRVDLHRRLGIAGAALGAVMMVLGAYVAITRMRDGLFVTTPDLPRLAFLAIPLATVVVFSTLFGIAIFKRKRRDVHKRLVLIATLELVTAAIARWPVVSALGPLGFFGGTDLFLVALVAYDLATLKRVHPATLWGGLFLIVSQPLRIVIGLTPQWLAFAGWLTG